MNEEDQKTGAFSRKRLVALLDHHETLAAALRMTLDLMDDTARGVKQENVTALFTKALAIDGARVAKRQEKAPKAPPKARDQSGTGKAARQARIARSLSKMSKTVPKKYGVGVYQLMKNGWLIHAPDKPGYYLRTDKPYP